MGKDEPLKVISNKYDFSIKEIFFKSLITYIAKPVEILKSVQDSTEEQSIQYRDDTASTVRIIREEYVDGSIRALNRMEEASYSELNQSPHIDFDACVLAFVKPGLIHSVKVYENRNTGKAVMLFKVKGYNEYANIGRSHKRNNIYIVANVAGRYIQQRCFKCSNFWGERIYVDQSKKVLFDEAEDADLLLAADEY